MQNGGKCNLYLNYECRANLVSYFKRKNMKNTINTIVLILISLIYQGCGSIKISSRVQNDMAISLEQKQQCETLKFSLAQDAQKYQETIKLYDEAKTKFNNWIDKIILTTDKTSCGFFSDNIIDIPLPDGNFDTAIEASKKFIAKAKASKESPAPAIAATLEVVSLLIKIYRDQEEACDKKKQELKDLLKRLKWD